MTLTDLAVILFGLFAGYWVVSKLFFRAPKAPMPVPAETPVPWYQVLKVDPQADLQTIEAAYQSLRDGSQQIEAAYKAGRAARGALP